MPESKPGASLSINRPRNPYSRLICLGCRERRIRCELPSGLELPGPGELRTVETPCYRCKKLGVPCIVRKTVLGRPGPGSRSTKEAQLTGDFVSRIFIDLELPERMVSCSQPTTHAYTAQEEAQLVNSSIVPRRSTQSRYSNALPPNQQDPTPRNGGTTLVLHTPQSPESVLIIRAIDTLCREKVESEWFRHLPSHVGHTPALDLSIKAIVAACAYARGVPRLTAADCYHALEHALAAVQTHIKKKTNTTSSQRLGVGNANLNVNDDILASTALLAPFDGVIKKHGVPARLHVHGLAAILTARAPSYPVSQLARDILDFHVCDSAVLAVVRETPSPFEGVPRKYFGDGDGDEGGSERERDRGRLKAIGSELFIRIPRLVGLVRSLSVLENQNQNQDQNRMQMQVLGDALRLSNSVANLQDPEAEERLLRTIEIMPSKAAAAAAADDTDGSEPLHVSQSQNPSFAFTDIDDFEALAYYWVNRLWLLRLEARLHALSSSITVSGDGQLHDDATAPTYPSSSFQPASILPTYEHTTTDNATHQIRLSQNLLMCADYVAKLPLLKHERLFAHAMLLVWGAMMDGLDISNGDGDGDEDQRQTLRDLVLGSVSKALGAKTGLEVQDMEMDEAAEIFVGGRVNVEGRWVRFYCV